MNFLKKFNNRKQIKKKFSNLFKNGKKNLIKKNIINPNYEWLQKKN